MAIFDVFSKRQKRLNGGSVDPFRYDVIPEGFRVQLIHVLKDLAGSDWRGNLAPGPLEQAHSTLCREYGQFALADSQNAIDNLFQFILSEKKVERILDAIEVSVDSIMQHFRNRDFMSGSIHNLSLPDAINELNQRFREHSIGYQYIDSSVVRLDSEFAHSEIVLPAIKVLRGTSFASASDEFLNAHQHYRRGNHKEALVDCLKAIESTMRSICTQKKWVVDKSATAKPLIKACLDNGLLPDFMETQIHALRSLLESGVPTLRNKLGGHGQGQSVTIVSAATVRYALNLTASTILFLSEASGFD